MSNSLDESDLSSALYLNQGGKTKSHKSKEKSTIATTDNLGLKIRVIKGLIDIRMMMKKNAHTICLIIIVAILINMALQVILFYFLYTSTYNCYFNDKGQGTIIDKAIENNQEQSEDTTGDENLPKKRDRNNDYYWMTQIFNKIENAHITIGNKIKAQLITEFAKIANKLESLISEQEAATKGFYMLLEDTARFEFQTPKGRGTHTDNGNQPRVNWPRPPRTRPTRKSIWIGPTGIPGYALMSKCKTPEK